MRGLDRRPARLRERRSGFSEGMRIPLRVTANPRDFFQRPEVVHPRRRGARLRDRALGRLGGVPGHGGKLVYRTEGQGGDYCGPTIAATGGAWTGPAALELRVNRRDMTHPGLDSPGGLQAQVFPPAISIDLHTGRQAIDYTRG